MVKHNGTALITGASAGIGKTFAHHLAEQKYNLILTARREKQLNAIADELTGKFGISVETFTADLSSTEDMKKLVSRISNCPDLSLLINNAGFGYPGPIAEADIEILNDMNSVHLDATLRLCRVALPGMIERRRGYIINVSSLAGFLHSPGSAIYCATKAYLINFSQSLQAEVKPYGIKIQALCPGFTHTELHATETMADFDKTEIPAWMWTDSDFVVAVSLKALNNNKVVCIPGRLNRLIAWLMQGRITRPLLLMHARSHYKRRTK